MASEKSECTIRQQPLPKERGYKRKRESNSFPPTCGATSEQSKKMLGQWLLGRQHLLRELTQKVSEAQGSSRQQKGLLAELLPAPLLIIGLRLGKVFTSLVVSWSCVNTFWLKYFTSFGPAPPPMAPGSLVHSLQL